MARPKHWGKTEEHYCRVLLRSSNYPGENARKNYANGRRTGTRAGWVEPHLMRILSGSCRIERKEKEPILLSAGDYWYIPKRMPYQSFWQSEDMIHYEVLEFDADYFSLYYTETAVFRLPELDESFACMWKAQKEKDNFSFLKEFYSVLTVISSRLKRCDNPDMDRILPALKKINEDCKENISVSELAALCHLSTSRFYEIFREAVGTSPIEHKNMIKVSRAEVLLREGHTAEEICELLNFSSPAFLRRQMKKHLGMTPGEIKKKSSSIGIAKAEE